MYYEPHYIFQFRRFFSDGLEEPSQNLGTKTEVDSCVMPFFILQITSREVN